MAKDAKGHGSNGRGVSAVQARNSRMDAMFARAPGLKAAAQRAHDLGDSAKTPHATPLDVIRGSHDYLAAQELARGNPKAGAAPVHSGAPGRNDVNKRLGDKLTKMGFFGRA